MDLRRVLTANWAQPGGAPGEPVGRRGVVALLGLGPFAIRLPAASKLALPGAGFAFYDKRLRWTCFPVIEGAGWRWVTYEHDGGWFSPYAGSMNAPLSETGDLPKYFLRSEAGWLEVCERRGEKTRIVRKLMPSRSEHVAIYPKQAHGDIAALWSWGEGVYYTNRDWKNIYELPEAVLKGRVKGVRWNA